MVIPALIAVSWKQVEAPKSRPKPRCARSAIYTEAFYLIYPLLVLFMSLRIARERLGLAAVVVFFSFVCSSARVAGDATSPDPAKEALRREASRDGLTSLWNRKAILGILERELLRAERDRSPVGLIMIDVDHFKAVNDSRGHAAGDTVLRIIASGIAALVRPYDSVGRYGGEEFLIVAPGLRNRRDMGTGRARSRTRRGMQHHYGGSNVQVSLSLGIATGDGARNRKTCCSPPMPRSIRQKTRDETASSRASAGPPWPHQPELAILTATSGSRFFIADIARAGAPALLCFQSSRVIFRI